MNLNDFTKRNIIKLGLETDCPNCQTKNWHSLTSVDYEVTCDRCLEKYEFPQANLQDRNRNWRYRVTGPFSVPDFGRGSYSTLLTLRLIKNFGLRQEMTFTNAMNLNFNNIKMEVDFIAWCAKEKLLNVHQPELIIGESKSLGQGDVIDESDLRKLRKIGSKLPGSIIVIAILREQFNKSEIKLLKSFVEWGRRPDTHGRPTNPVLLLTSRELMFDFMISSTWKDLGEPYKSFSDYDDTRDLRAFAESTQRIYLNLPPYFEWYRILLKKRSKKRKVKTKKQ